MSPRTSDAVRRAELMEALARKKVVAEAKLLVQQERMLGERFDRREVSFGEVVDALAPIRTKLREAVEELEGAEEERARVRQTGL